MTLLRLASDPSEKNYFALSPREYVSRLATSDVISQEIRSSARLGEQRFGLVKKWQGQRFKDEVSRKQLQASGISDVYNFIIRAAINLTYLLSKIQV